MAARLLVALSMAVAGYVLSASVVAATPFSSPEPEAGVLSRDAGAVADAGPSAGLAVASSGWPASPPARVCDNGSILGGGPASAPQGAVTVPAGDNSDMSFALRAAQTTFWFAPGVHTLGDDEFSQIQPGSGSTYVGAPGAIIDGQDVNRFAFTQRATDVTIRYLTIRNFRAPLDQGVVNHDAGEGWTIEYNTIIDNEGAGLMAGPDNVYRFNCIENNGQYGINACCGTEQRDIENFVLDHNEIAGNNTGDWENQGEGCGCTGGVKFWINNDVTVTNNWVHDNHGAGLWLDNNNRGFIIEHNYIAGNEGIALFLEAGYDARVRYNNVKRNAIVEGREFQQGSDPFPVGAVYVSENGSPAGYGLKTVPTVVSHNNFEDNWGGVNLWENADRYCSSTAHTHPPACTIKVDLKDDAACESGVENVIPASIGDKYRCRWSTENVIVEDNVFRIDKAAVGPGCAGEDYCGISGVFGNFGSYPEFAGYVIPWRITFQQGNVFRNNRYYGEWKFAGFQTTQPNGSRVTWENWTAPAPEVPDVFTHGNRPETFGQDEGSTFNEPEVSANRAPTVDATVLPSSGAAPLRAEFSAAGDDADGDDLSYAWEFGDGAGVGGPSAVHTYTQPGAYDATVTVRDAKGGAGEVTVRVTVAASAGPERQRPAPPQPGRNDVTAET